MIGSGHVMRCLALAGTLRARRCAVSFVSREQPGDLCALIEEHGFAVHRLFAGAPARFGAREVSMEEEVEQTRVAIAALAKRPEWLVVDHYGLGRQWESALRGSVGGIMAIDDLADRPHDCNVLLDQNFNNPLHAQYAELLPEGAQQLLGTRYALVRPDFAQHREAALARRDGRLERVLVSMGGSDPENDTARVVGGLVALARDGLALDVVIGAGNPHREAVRALCDDLPGAELHVQTSRMAELMTRADLAVNGGGSTTWERCVLGLPAIVAIQSADQEAVATAIDRIGAHQVLGWSRDLRPDDYRRGVERLSPDVLTRMSERGAQVCDGMGADRVADHLMNRSS